MVSNEQLVTRIRNGGDGVCYALEQLWNQNQGLIQIYVKKYQGLAERDDLTQEAYIALCDAVDNYKPEESTFSTYLGFWLSSRMMKYCRNNTGPLRIPEWRFSNLYHLRKTESAFEQKFHRKPTRSELRRLLGMTEEELNQLILLDIATTPASLSAPVKSDSSEELTLGDTIADPSNMEECVIDQEYQKQMKKAIREELQKLPKDQADSIQLVYLEGFTMDKAGELLDVPRHRVQASIRKGFRALRGTPARRLKPFISEVSEAMAYKGSLYRFKYTGFSSTEKAAFQNLRREQEEEEV